MVGINKRLSVSITHDTHLRVYKSLIKPDFDFGGIIYDKPNNESFKN